MESKHIGLIVGALVLTVVGVYAITHIASAVKPAPDIDDQIKRLSGGVLN